jgi:hypothetical protein
MSIFQKKPKKSPEELRKEAEAKIAETSNKMRVQIALLEKKKETLLRKMAEARQKGLKQQEAQARTLLQQTMKSLQRQNGMFLQLELAIESRDLVRMNAEFYDCIGNLADDILNTSVENKESKTKRVNEKYKRAIFESNNQKEQMDRFLAEGDAASAIGMEGSTYAEFDEEIDAMLDDMQFSTADYVNNTPNKTRF